MIIRLRLDLYYLAKFSPSWIVSMFDARSDNLHNTSNILLHSHHATAALVEMRYNWLLAWLASSTVAR